MELSDWDEREDKLREIVRAVVYKKTKTCTECKNGWVASAEKNKGEE